MRRLFCWLILFGSVLAIEGAAVWQCRELNPVPAYAGSAFNPVPLSRTRYVMTGRNRVGGLTAITIKTQYLGPWAMVGSHSAKVLKPSTCFQRLGAALAGGRKWVKPLQVGVENAKTCSARKSLAISKRYYAYLALRKLLDFEACRANHLGRRA